MNLYFRLIGVIIRALFKERLGMREVSCLRLRVWPSDLDFNLHMTNSRYLALADLGRLDLILRTGIWRVLWRGLQRPGRLGVVLGGCTVRFRRALHPFERFTLSTSVLGWDDRWIYVRQIFRGRQDVACIAMMRAGFIRQGELVSPHEIIDASAGPAETLSAPDWIKTWDDLETAFVADARAAERRETN